jgi:hypothetical protein
MQVNPLCPNELDSQLKFYIPVHQIEVLHVTDDYDSAFINTVSCPTEMHEWAFIAQ